MYHREVMQFSIAGASASTGVIITNPLDVIKTRIQLRHDTMRPAALFDTARSIWAQEGLHGFWKGVQVSNLYRIQVGNAVGAKTNSAISLAFGMTRHKTSHGYGCFNLLTG